MLPAIVISLASVVIVGGFAWLILKEHRAAKNLIRFGGKVGLVRVGTDAVEGRRHEARFRLMQGRETHPLENGYIGDATGVRWERPFEERLVVLPLRTPISAVGARRVGRIGNRLELFSSSSVWAKALQARGLNKRLLRLCNLGADRIQYRHGMMLDVGTSGVTVWCTRTIGMRNEWLRVLLHESLALFDLLQEEEGGTCHGSVARSLIERSLCPVCGTNKPWSRIDCPICGAWMHRFCRFTHGGCGDYDCFPGRLGGPE